MEWVLPCSSLFGLDSEWLKVYMNKAGEVLLRYWWNKFLGVSILISFEGLAREVTSTALLGNEPRELVHPKCQHIWRLKTQFCCEFWCFDAHMTPICSWEESGDEADHYEDPKATIYTVHYCTHVYI